MECSEVWAGAANCYLDMLDKLKMQTCRDVASSPAASLEPMTLF